MKIVYVSSARLPSERAHGLQIIRMCDALAGLGHEVLLLHPAKRQAIEYLQDADVWEYYDCKNKFEVESMSIFQLPDFLWRLPSLVHRPLMNSVNLWFEKRMAKRALELGADVFISRDMTPHSALKIAEGGGRCILEFHQAPSGALATKSLRKLATKLTNVYPFAVTRLLADDIETQFGLSAGSIDVHHDGVNLEMFVDDSAPKASGRPLVTYVGSIQTNRGVDVLVESALHCPELDFRIVGGTPAEVSPLEALAERLKLTNVSFVGQVRPQEVPYHLQSANLIVMPMRGNELHTQRHASPLKLFEYMASGTPIVATDMPSVREVVEHKDSAFLVEPDDSKSLATGIKSVLADPDLAGRMGTRARSVVANYSWSRRAGQMIELSGESFN